MKIFFVTGLLATFSVILIVSLDLMMGIGISGIIWKAINPFKVMEPAEYVIIFLFLLFFVIDTFGSYLNKKKKKQNPTN
ncbi:hypothetical protein [Neobacillus sp. SuZ13]|uniref:hypothetical protein n=1 Tax=Neobacillus sp. SuZ13 TaxID=3047875 RepID=UPI0024BF4F81|nr:hypothetical protein [Neobacillus sp. SuZ13]WHY69242.1 hypothetical protein QNH17_11645 [Neobacillus sp. SuZ13]